jgi:cellulose synthase/poly-beta-1,6-N-acetylglucosamine synthase-like glycosyltransferase
MPALLSPLLVTVAVLIAIPVFLFLIEVLAAITLPQPEYLLPPIGAPRQRIAVLLPAHNESNGLLKTLENIKAQLRPGDRLVVVADNCTDDTGVIARGAAAEVTERQNPAKIGKGYALDWGIRYLSADPPEVVVVIDADCRLAPSALDQLVTTCAATKRPTQALYLMNAPDESPIDYQVALFAFRVRNWVRPLGLRALNLPCQLMGTGMAFPWDVIRSAELATGQAVEDLKLGLDLTRTGNPPLFCPSAGINSDFPSSIKGAVSQRKRWEQGHIGMIATALPGLFYDSVTQGNFRLLVLTLDMSIPPLTLLSMLLSLTLLASWIGVHFGLSSSALVIATLSLSAYIIAVLLCWFKFCGGILSVSSIFSVISYVVAKFPVYRRILSGRDNPQWVRTDRDKSENT